MLHAVRAFFAARSAMEVDCSALRSAPPIDANIDVITAEPLPGRKAYLHTSPEYAMKGLLSQGSGDLFYLGHVFRYGEEGHRHLPEFTMIEWYRIGFSLAELIQETAELMALFLGPQPLELLSYREAFRHYVGLDPSHASLAELRRVAQHDWDRETLLHYLMSHKIEPELGKEGLTALTHYPPDQAALAQLVEQDGELAAERFEIYHRGVELCNGYHELVDAKEQERRFHVENELRRQKGREVYPIDQEFLKALRRGLPDCSGVAVGFDRLMLLRHNGAPISTVVC